MIIGAGTLDTKGGRKINASAQVLDTDDRPIAGLYGAGNCIGSPAGQGIGRTDRRSVRRSHLARWLEGTPPGRVTAEGAHINGATILVTGCSSGFGELAAQTLARKGHRVFASMRGVASKNAAAASRLLGWANERALALEVADMDVTDDRSVHACVDGVLRAAGHIDVVINNAGRGSIGPIEAFSMTQIEQLMSTNALGPIRVDRAVLPSMRRRGAGLLVHISSTVGRVLPGPGGVYGATKWALEAFAESLSHEVKPFGIDVAILEPGAYPATATMARAVMPEHKDIAGEYAKVAAPFRLTVRDDSPQDVADAIAKLIDTPAGYRPLRTVVGRVMTEGVAEFNAVYERTKTRLIESFE